MIKSETTKEIFAALAKMQFSLQSVPKSQQGHGYKYADLAGCIEAAKQPLRDNGLAVTQMMGLAEGGTTLITLLTHESGEYIGSEFLMEKAVLHGGAGNNPAQAMGASITYMRRYAYAAILGLAQEDTDAANGEQPKGSKSKSDKSAASKAYNDAKTQPITDAQRKHLQAFYSNHPDFPDRDSRIASLTKFCHRTIKTMNDMTKDEASALIEAINKMGSNNAG
jgi:hypothetical protein